MMKENLNYSPGETVYILIRNPHVQNVASIEQATIVEHPEEPEKLALFAHDHFYPLKDDFAIFSTEMAAEIAYQEAFELQGGETDS